MAPYVRTVVATTVDGPRGVRRSRAVVDDPFHGFEVRLDVLGDRVVDARAASHRHPWSTCPGALASASHASGALAQAADAVLAQPRADTCVHVNDMVRLATACHPHRRYRIEVTPYGLSAQRDGAPLFGWRLREWTIASPGPFRGLSVGGAPWREVLAARGADDDEREAIRVARRSLLVAIGYFDLDWRVYETAADIDAPSMAGSCHTFSPVRLESARRLAVPPDTTLFG